MPSPPYHIGDLLALARQSWVREMARRLSDRGYPDYRASDAAVMRRLQNGSFAIGQLATAYGVTRQTARKIVTALEARGLASTDRDRADGRQVNVVLTPAGRTYASAVIAAIDELNADYLARLTPDQIDVTDTALRLAIFDDDLKAAADRFVPRPPTRS
jgi:DNA-binding MarR family transcriptional regulator